MLILQTLRFVQSLPKREKVPFTTKFPNADPLGEWALREIKQGVCQC